MSPASAFAHSPARPFARLAPEDRHALFLLFRRLRTISRYTAPRSRIVVL